MKVTEQFYEFALWRYNALAKEMNENIPADDDRLIELSLMSEIIKDYKRKNLPFAKVTTADIIKAALEERKMTQRQLAGEIGVSPSRVNDFISGKSEPSLRIAAKICQTLHIPTSLIMNV